MKALQSILLALQYFPVVLQGVAAVQSTLHGAPGATKKAVVMSAIQAGAQAVEATPEEHIKVISTLVDSMVGALVETGWFSKGAVATAPAGTSK